MQRTVRTLRLVIPLAFVSFVAFIFVSYTANSRRDRAPGEAITSTIRKGDQPRLVADVFEDTQTLGGRTLSRIRARRTMGFASGWTTLEGVTLTLYRNDGGEYELTAAQAQFNSKTKEAEVKGGVKVRSSDGIELLTEEMKFDGTHLLNEIPVDFKFDTWQGRAGAISLSVEDQTLLLDKGVTAASSSGSLPGNNVKISSQQTLFRRKDGVAEFRGKATVVRELDRLESDLVEARFDQSRKVLVGLEGSGNTRMMLARNSGLISGAGDAGTLQADRFRCEMTATGGVAAVHILGEKGPARADLTGPPARHIDATSFLVTLTDHVVTQLQAVGAVHLVETGQERRRIDSDRMKLYFDKATRAAVSGLMEGSFRYDDGRNQATSERADYDILGDRVVMTEVPGSSPTLRSGGHSLKADRIELSPKAGMLKAMGNVISQLESKGGAPTSSPSASGTSLFPGDRTVFVNADSLLVRQAVRTASFSGNVRAWQDNNTLFASELQVTGAGDQIEARGGVRALLYNAPGEARKAPLTARGDQLSGRKLSRKLELSGAVRVEDGSRVLSSDRATFFFDATRKIERVEAESKVVMTEAVTKRKGSGEKAVYQIAKKFLTLTGSPAEMSDPQGNVRGQQILFDLAKNKVDVISGGSPNEASYRP
ncbi:MAG TPA: LptA/OstA family protein [Thermoanaerobaculia bacterium]|nr:LptA/OstA family protein [Thermoanaerobaculia bacterium]